MFGMIGVRYCISISLRFFFFFKQKTAYEMQRGLVGSEMCIRDRSVTAAALAVCSLTAAEPPKDVFATISTKDFNTSLSEVEGLSGSVVKGTPAQSFTQSGFLKALLFAPNSELGLSSDFIENGKPVSLVIFFDDSKGEPDAVLLLPTGDLDKKLGGLEANGSEYKKNRRYS
eukprot:TRINITY_DN53221_c0_g1_i1.p1 TRINITY_DN53221_c0_g1~~TRINITY_DN53221_c0_g1_i1.p1  ORF type:complete len:172 (+),score=55.18 TRINITY_DN53221_c0_g1_i1:30-545(+)